MKKVGLSILDRAISAISPQAGLNRMMAKAKLTQFDYDAVKYNRERKGPSILRGAENYRSTYDRVELMKRARDLSENVGLVRSLLLKFASHVAGSISYQARTTSSEANMQIERYWTEWWENCDISTRHSGSTLMQIAVMSMLRDGDFLFILNRDGDGNLKIQGIEADRLGDPFFVYTDNKLIGGVHIEPSTGRPIAYDIYARSIGNAYSYQTTVPSNQAFHLYDPLRIDQYRGISAFHTAINDATDLHEIIGFEKQAAKYASGLSGIVKRSNNNAADLSDLVNDTNINGNQIKLEQIEGGKISYLEVGEDIVFPAGPARPSGAFQEFAKLLYRNICLGLGLPYSFAIDPSAMSGPTARLEMQQAGRTFKRYQKLIDDKILRPLKSIVIADAQARGLLPSIGTSVTKGMFNFGANVTIDLGRESASAIQEFKSGLRTAADIYAERGQDFESAMRQRAQEAQYIKNLAEKYGIDASTISDAMPPAQPTQMPQNQQQMPQGEPIEQPEGEDSQTEDKPEEPEDKEEGEDPTESVLSKLSPKEINMLIKGVNNGIKLGRYDDIDFTPPEGARESARRALDIRAKKPASQRGMTPVGIARARDLINGKNMSPDTVKRMKAFFDRHEIDKKAKGWDEQGAGWQAWNGWGGDAGYSWAKKIVGQMESKDQKR